MAEKTLLAIKFPFLTAVMLQSRISWSIRLRWLAIFGYFLATFVVSKSLNLELPYTEIWTALAVLGGINILYYIFCRFLKNVSLLPEMAILSVHIIIDLIFLTILVHYSGGIENPVYLFYVFHVVISSIIFPGWIPLVFASLAVSMFVWLVFNEYLGYITHYCVFNSTLHDNDILIPLILIVFVITVYVTAYICMTFMGIYRDSKRIIDEQNERLVKADQQKSQFFRFASHELKSPIISIKTSLDGILKTFSGSIDPKAVNLLRRASSRSEQMLEIIKELLELSRDRTVISASQKKLVLLDALIGDICEQERHLADEKQIEMINQLEAVQFEISGDPQDFQKIFSNLVSNAIRYTPEKGKVWISTKLENNSYIFQVRDTGIGIAEQDLKEVFSEFYRSENAKKMVTYGTGLGLSLVKKLVEHHKGQVKVESDVGKGTAFTVSFPTK